MRRGLLTLLMLLASSSLAWAQAQFVAATGAAETPKVSPDAVVSRLMTFDQNHDGRVGITELSERMRPLMDRGDKNGDGALDAFEIHALAVTTLPPTQHAFTRSSGYSFGDDAGLSTRSHIEGAIEDLRLTSDKTTLALPIVRRYVDQLEKDAKADLLRRMEPLLSPQQFQAFTTLLDNQQREITLRTNDGVATTRVIRMMASGDLTRRLDAMGIFSFGEKSEEAHKAIDEFKLRVRLGRETDRSELLAQLTEVLSDEELDNYRAAIERRPIVANSLARVTNTAVFRTVEQSGSAPVVFVGDVSTPSGVPVRVR